MSTDGKGQKRVSLRRHPLTVTRWRALLVICVSMAAVAFTSLGYTAYSDRQRSRIEREADRRWCRLLTLVNGAYVSTPPTSTLGEQLAAAYRELIEELGCPAE